MRSIDRGSLFGATSRAALAIAMAILIAPLPAYADPSFSVGLEAAMAIPTAGDSTRAGLGGGGAVFFRDEDFDDVGARRVRPRPPRSR